MASTMSKNKRTHKAAAVKALTNAEAYFKLQKLDSAIKEATQAKNLDPNLPNVDNFITAYKIHKAMSFKKNWYVVLDIPECSHLSIIKKRFRALALMVHPDKNLSAAAEDAFKHVKDALDFLSDPVRKEDYDKSFMSKNKAFAAAAAAAKMPETTAAARKAAAAAAAAAMARKAAMEAFAAKVAAERKAAKAAAKIRKAAADAAALEAELAAAKRKLAAETAAASRKASEAAAASRKAAETAAASRKAAEAATPAAAKEAAAAAARSAINARKRREPISELEYAIHLIMKYSPNYMERRFSVR
ncbi:PREDICTED: uncharacterized abhydrolase domain-containing protein DDB_G0269086-like [Fragaria vesca subsp. vesca]|uniref:uncharacterized abhydrolase domain-containing protein DDB_G0269086-like n=1 Tax=Fragaria vesca subsp. vesca TaxID=101020 RepID=UPI0002C2E8AC|nr:PREDICTED: uncharacterized abhydrolase domain-containing protein DDB_G0269086-like [Fragaria vesca subsp. vesca]